MAATMNIHPSAIVDPKAEIQSGVEIGPYCVIGHGVKIGQNTVLKSHVVLEGNTRIGRENVLYPFSTIGTPPQDVGYRGEDTRVVIGDKNIIREYVTIHRATTKEKWQTVVGNKNYLMAYAHIAHDCQLGDEIIMSNVATLGGHIRIGDHANLGGLVAVHQFVRIGAYAFLGGKSGVDRDVPPFMVTAGERAKLYGINRKGLRRTNIPKERLEDLTKAYRIIWRENKSFRVGIEQAKRRIPPSPELELLLNFLQESKRGVLR
jgi:UDP-N-acetylglucosamine acyltransferase